MNVLFNELLNQIGLETQGFGIGEPWSVPIRASFATVLPIIRQTRFSRHYVTASELGHGLTMKDTGAINVVNITNNLVNPVFISAGQMVWGNTQDRAVAMSIILKPGETRPVSVVCVHQSHSITNGAEMKVGPNVPRPVEQELFCPKRGVFDSRQGEVWKRIIENDPADNQNDNLRIKLINYRTKIQAIIDQVPEIPDQIGMAIFVGSGIYSLQVFDSPDSWRERRKAIIEKEFNGLGQLADDSSLTQGARPDDITRMFREFILQSFEFESEQIETGPDWQTLEIEAGNHVGEATIWNEDVIHFSLGLKPAAMQLERIARECKHTVDREEGRDYGRGFVHSDQVTKISLNLYESLASQHCFRKSNTDLFLLRAAGYLHDVGVPPETNHHINGFNLLKTRLKDLISSGSLSKAEYSIILYCVLWHRKDNFDQIDADVKLSPQELITARRLAGVLRIADGLCFPAGAPTLRIHTYREREVLVIEACPAKHGDTLQTQTSKAMTKINLLEAELKIIPTLGINKIKIKKCSHDGC